MFTADSGYDSPACPIPITIYSTQHYLSIRIMNFGETTSNDISVGGKSIKNNGNTGVLGAVKTEKIP